jgi:hypothetical protein
MKGREKEGKSRREKKRKKEKKRKNAEICLNL